VVYLNRAYAHIYNTIGAANLPYPQTREYMVGEKTASTTKIVFLGDSLTAGVGVKWLEDTYPYQVAEKISANFKQTVAVLNLGIPGATSVDVLNNQVVLANNFAPDKVVVFIGINDMHNRVGKNVLSSNLLGIINKLKVDKRNIYLVDMPYLGNAKSFFWPWQNYFLYQTNRYNEVYQNIWKNIGVTPVDVLLPTDKQFFDNTSWYAPDGFHPNVTGYQQIAKHVYYYMYNNVLPL